MLLKHNASLCQNDASGSYLGFLPDEVFSTGDLMTVESARRTFCANLCTLVGIRTEKKAFLRCNNIYLSLVISDNPCSI
ncbi:unnamed protein product [Periconia digitata]|uniref:Uncharacterized protein n=1 Tax=Periconia digitata TaxID=1303443 RepID=A0A9W4XL36_9PLEO|nr:unnamed protein product [Periconia digitata]